MKITQQILTIILFQLMLLLSVNTQNVLLETLLGPLRLIKSFSFNILKDTEETPGNINLLKWKKKLQIPVPNNKEFPCPLVNTRSKTPPDSVHKLRPGDIDVIAGMGDSLTAGVGSLASNVFQLVVENRGVAPSAGGEGTWRQFLTLPNILKEFNPNLVGYATGTSISLERKSQLNVGETGAESADMLYMAAILIQRIAAHPKINITHHWKMITYMIGPNDFCLESCYQSDLQKVLDEHKKDLLTVLRLLRDKLPRTIVNILPAPNIKLLANLRHRPAFCDTINLMQCPCVFGYLAKYRKVYFEFMSKWQQIEIEIANADEFDQEDFAVVAQPFTVNYFIPNTTEGGSDYSYLAEDCFHMSQKANARISNSLWNNILEPVGNKSAGPVELFSEFRCPTEKNPYIYTKRNSKKLQ